MCETACPRLQRSARRSIFETFMLLFVPCALSAQDSLTIRGTVVDSAGRPVPAAVVLLEGHDIGMLSDRLGRFQLTAPPVDVALLRVERIGYGPWSRLLRLPGDHEVTAVLVEVPLHLDPICTMDSRPAVVVTVIDSVAGAPLGIEARAEVRDGAFSEVLEQYGSRDGVVLSYSGAGERKGTYHVSVSAPGYRTWTAGPVEVGDEPNDCHVATARLTARMVRGR